MSMIEQLPPPPSDKNGWPWTTETKPLPPNMPNDEPWPRISLVTPSFNQGRYLEETIRSVLLQNYPNIEYIIIDGGSTDNSVEIIKKYEPWLTYWESKSDRGQSHAINKGFARCTGDIYNWLCSDDILLDGALTRVAMLMNLSRPSWLIGGAYGFDERSKSRWKRPLPETVSMINFLLWPVLSLHQPSVFWNRKLFTTVKGINEELHYCMDTDLWLQFYKQTEPEICQALFSQSRKHEDAKTTNYGRLHEAFKNELSHWIITNICSEKETKYNQEWVNAFNTMQEQIIAFDRIKTHVVIGKFIKFWKAFINPQLPS